MSNLTALELIFFVVVREKPFKRPILIPETYFRRMEGTSSIVPLDHHGRTLLPPNPVHAIDAPMESARASVFVLRYASSFRPRISLTIKLKREDDGEIVGSRAVATQTDPDVEPNLHSRLAGMDAKLTLLLSRSIEGGNGVPPPPPPPMPSGAKRSGDKSEADGSSGFPIPAMSEVLKELTQVRRTLVINESPRSAYLNGRTNRPRHSGTIKRKDALPLPIAKADNEKENLPQIAPAREPSGAFQYTPDCSREVDEGDLGNSPSVVRSSKTTDGFSQQVTALPFIMTNETLKNTKLRPTGLLSNEA
ncbi:hypothetical protein BJ742DRAFT_886343 [Cladochytrium replicatum]|nr:hypothetical protein BJ742DRAFT_886343 [Cladochytrium replicatum]